MVPEKFKGEPNWRARRKDPLGFLNINLLPNIKNKLKRGPFEILKVFGTKNEK